MKKRITKKAVDHAKEILRLYAEQTGVDATDYDKAAAWLKEQGIDEDEQINLGTFDNAGYRNYIYVYSLLAKYKITPHHPQPISKLVILPKSVKVLGVVDEAKNLIGNIACSLHIDPETCGRETGCYHCENFKSEVVKDALGQIPRRPH